jgi:hypothetical protein
MIRPAVAGEDRSAAVPTREPTVEGRHGADQPDRAQPGGGAEEYDGEHVQQVVQGGASVTGALTRVSLQARGGGEDGAGEVHVPILARPAAPVSVVSTRSGWE